jgi:hypothetical protein
VTVLVLGIEGKAMAAAFPWISPVFLSVLLIQDDYRFL